MKKFSGYLLLFVLLLSMVPSSFSINHTSFSKILTKYVAVNGNVDYKALSTNRAALNDYLKLLQSNPPKEGWSKNEKMAYWINAYNAFTIDLVLQNYPLKSIMEINNGKPWDLNFISIGNTKYSLNKIEHEILRKEYNDARIHFAVNCASISCPKLLNVAYEASTLDNQLNSSAKGFVNNKEKNRITTGAVEISKIFDWFVDDFKTYGGVIPFINKFSTVKVGTDALVKYKEYNWNLNE
jgi:hypothetical protein